jgi:glutamate 5-kinase
MMQRVTLRPELPETFKTLLVKIGSAALAHPDSGVNQQKISQIVADCNGLLLNGIQVILVSSGAIQIGRHHIGRIPDETIDYLQACSAIGQPSLMNCYSRAFADFGKICAQVLLTHEDLRNRKRCLNLKNMILRLLKSGITPILNENDSVSFAEITVGDNDQLAAMVAEMIEADALVLLTTPDGLFDRDPGTGTAEPLKTVAFDQSFQTLNLSGKSAAGRGGMKTKLEAVRKLTPLGIPVMLATYKNEKPILEAIAGGGTFFEASPKSQRTARHRWMMASVRLGAVVHVDKGAAEAVLKNSSLLASGIRNVEGGFGRGDCVKIVCGRQELGTGLVEYSAVELRKIQGRKSEEIEGILGYRSSKVAIHRNNLVLKGR